MADFVAYNLSLGEQFKEAMLPGIGVMHRNRSRTSSLSPCPTIDSIDGPD